ncbi:MAG: redoxin domain-containing protein [Chloroflexi bacterium]|nr:redoxin domain-containing protein [Chloroflexota bacterium]
MMHPRTLARYGAVAAIAVVVGGVFVWREVLPTADSGTLGVEAGASRPAIGEPAPDFLLETPGTHGLVRLSDLRGQPVLLNFWATWCGPCRTEMPDLQVAHDTEGVVVFAVNSQEPDAAVTRFVEEFGLSFPTAIDRDGAVREHYGVIGLPATFFIDPEGILRARNFGPVYGDLLADGIEAARPGQ